MAMFSSCLIFFQFQSIVAYKSVAYYSKPVLYKWKELENNICTSNCNKNYFVGYQEHL